LSQVYDEPTTNIPLSSRVSGSGRRDKSQSADSLNCSQVGFDEPGIDATGDLGEESSAIRIDQLGRLPDGIPDMFAEGGEHRSGFSYWLSVRRSVRLSVKWRRSGHISEV
jgi:hypothetical protein